VTGQERGAGGPIKIPVRDRQDWRPATGDPQYIPTMDTIDRIERTLDTLRPYIASHRGQVEVVDFDEQDGVLLLRLGGTCHGCSASTVTLKQGIESRLRQMVPEVKHVEAV
jgi:Fe-S cluster biogenesis protein NfuA